MNIQETVQQFVMNYGLISVFVLVLLEYASVPLPSELVLPLIGIIGATHGISFFTILIVSLIAGIIGSLTNYVIGYFFGEKVINFIERKFPRMKKSVDASYNWIEKYDNPAVLVSRLVPVARTLISLIAGVVKMRPFPFIAFSSIGIVVWNSLLIGLGFLFGNNKELIGTILHRYSIAVVIIAILVFLFLIIKNKEKIKNLFN